MERERCKCRVRRWETRDPGRGPWCLNCGLDAPNTYDLDEWHLQQYRLRTEREKST